MMKEVAVAKLARDPRFVRELDEQPVLCKKIIFEDGHV